MSLAIRYHRLVICQDSSLIRPIYSIVTSNFALIHRHEHFARHGDAFLVVTPGRILLFVANAEVINQITMRCDHFPKDIELYHMLTQFGQNVLTSERAAWRVHRRATAASFNERNAALIFRESARQALGLLRFWDDRRAAAASPTFYTAENDTMRLSLNIITYVGFGLRLPWPGEKAPQELDLISAKYGSVEPPTGFRFSFVDTMRILVHNTLLLLLTPSGCSVCCRTSRCAMLLRRTATLPNTWTKYWISRSSRRKTARATWKAWT